ncbi:MAG: ABC transporter ATP-binding protein [Desulfitobacteriaceae bacterium]
MSQELLEVEGLKTSFYTENGLLTAIDDVSFTVNSGETLGIVGESGCGKSVTALSIMRLFDPRNAITEGIVKFDNMDILNSSEEEMEKIRGQKISMIFQDPMTSLNPVFKIGDQLMEALVIHQKLSKQEALHKAIEMLRLVGIPSPEKRINDYPSQLSGGMCQRVMIAMSLSCNPKLLIADEPTTALDVTIQAQIINLMLQLKREFNMAIVLITHDLGVVTEMCQRILIMYLGQIVEELDVDTLFDTPKHPYTIGLLRSMPTLDKNRLQRLDVIEGTVPSLVNIPKGCRFAGRCHAADVKCYSEPPVLIRVNDHHRVRCWMYQNDNMATSKERSF